jgi:hypothetical protein
MATATSTRVLACLPSTTALFTETYLFHYLPRSGKNYCHEDYLKLLTPTCAGCRKPIIARSVTGLVRCLPLLS